MKHYNPVDFSQNEIRNVVVQQLASAPSSPLKGQLYGNTSSGVALYWNGSTWRPLDAAALTDGSIQIAALATNPLARANHTGTQAASTISDLAATVKGYTLDSFAAPIATIGFGGQRIANVGTATQGTDAVTLAQVNSIVAAAVAGQKAVKNPVRGVFTTNVTLSGVQNTDGVTGSTTDPTNRWLVAAQTDATQNGVYQMNSGAWTRVTDADEPAEWVEGTEVLVLSGTAYGGTIWRQTASGTGGVVTPGTSAMNFTLTAKINTYSGDGTTIAQTGNQFSVNYGSGLTVSGGKLVVDPAVVSRTFTGTITCDGSTTSFPFTHGLGKAGLGVTCRDASGAAVWIDNVSTTTTITFAFATAQASGVTFTVIVTG